MPFVQYLLPYLCGLIEPGYLLFFAVQAYVEVFLDTVRTQPKFPDLQAIRGKAFGIFWEKISQPPDPSVPLVGSAALIPSLVVQSSGVVLDVGPGSGMSINRFDPAIKSISKIYGAEPCIELHPILQKNAALTAVGREGKYEVLAADASRTSVAKALVREGIISSPEGASEVFDTAVCIRVLCSVPNLDATIADLWKMLKPGGKLLICEHTVNPWRSKEGSLFTRFVQSLYMFMGWGYFIGDCSLTRDTEEALRAAPDRWESVKLERHFGKAVLPYIAGVLVKKTW